MGEQRAAKTVTLDDLIAHHSRPGSAHDTLGQETLDALERLKYIQGLAREQREEPLGGWAPGALAINQISHLHNVILRDEQ